MAFAFENLLVYQNAVDFADAICARTEQFARGYGFLVDQLNHTVSAPDGGVRLSWSSPLEPKGLVPTRCLGPVIPGGHTTEDLRSPSLWATNPGNK